MEKIIKKISNSKNITSILFSLIFLLAIVLLFLLGFYIKNKNELARFENSSTSSSKLEAEDIINRVGKLLILPENETPTLATVNDPSKLRDQAFFANAKAGDIVLIYTKAEKAILYRPSENKIVEIAPFNISDTPSAITTTTKKK